VFVSDENDLVWGHVGGDDGCARVDLTISDFEAAGLGAELAAIESAVGDHLEGRNANVAVIGEPYAGRDLLLSHAESQLGAASGHVAFDSPVTDPSEIEFPNREVIVVEGCHYLYRRHVGGFDVLDAFLERLAESDAMFVTAWNRWAWDYLAGVHDVDRAFPVQVPIPRLDAEAITHLVESHVEELPSFVETEDHGRVKTLDITGKRVNPIGDLEVSIPTPELNLEYLTSRDLDERYGDVERVVYERLANLAEGNPGVALALWDRAVEDGELSPASLEEPEGGLSLDDDAAFALTTVLCKERLAIDALERVRDDLAVPQAVDSLANQGLVTVSDGVVSVAPERFHAAVEHLEGRRYLW
jgi:hypothetical protein